MNNPEILESRQAITDQRVVVSGFIYNKGKTLILRRSGIRDFLPEYYELPGGKLEYGEEPRTGVLREVEEEAGISCYVRGVHCIWDYVVSFPKEKRTTHFVQLGFILEPCGDSQIILGGGMDDYKWITEDEINTYKMTDEMKNEIRSGFLYTKKIKL